MALGGIDTLLYGVNDLATCTKYFEGFGLLLKTSSATESAFQLEDGS